MTILIASSGDKKLVFTYNFDSINNLRNIIEESELVELKSSINSLVEDIKQSSLSIWKNGPSIKNENNKNRVINLCDYFITNKFEVDIINFNLINDYRSLCGNWNRICNENNIELQNKIDELSVSYNTMKVSDYVPIDNVLNVEEATEFKNLI